VVLVNKVLIIAYDIKQQLLLYLGKQTESNQKHTLTHFSPLIYIQDFVPEARARTKYVTIYFCLKMLNRK